MQHLNCVSHHTEKHAFFIRADSAQRQRRLDFIDHGIGGQSRIGRLPDRPPHHDVVRAAGKRRRYTHGALLIVAGRASE